jgi:hypothetical protein
MPLVNRLVNAKVFAADYPELPSASDDQAHYF